MSNEKFYCAVKTQDLQSIFDNGLNTGSYWISDTHESCDSLLDYYREMEDNQGKTIESTVLSVSIKDIDMNKIKPDYPGIEEPITLALDMDEDEIMDEWEKTEGTGRECINLIGTMKYDDIIPSHVLLVEVGNDLIPLQDYINQNKYIK